ncbi:transposase [Meiothermus sp. Pnk-1]
MLPPRPAKGRRRGQDRAVLSGIMYRLKTGCRRRDMPPGAPATTGLTAG